MIIDTIFNQWKSLLCIKLSIRRITVALSIFDLFITLGIGNWVSKTMFKFQTCNLLAWSFFTNSNCGIKSSSTANQVFIFFKHYLRRSGQNHPSQTRLSMIISLTNFDLNSFILYFFLFFRSLVNFKVMHIPSTM